MAKRDRRQEQHENPVREAWILCLFLGLVMLNFPFIQIFNFSKLVLGIPTLVLYLFFGWFVSILVIYLFARQDSGDSNSNGSEP
jgi:uncharacterized membrane-anchored protein